MLEDQSNFIQQPTVKTHVWGLFMISSPKIKSLCSLQRKDEKKRETQDCKRRPES